MIQDLKLKSKNNSSGLSTKRTENFAYLDHEMWVVRIGPIQNDIEYGLKVSSQEIIIFAPSILGKIYLIQSNHPFKNAKTTAGDFCRFLNSIPLVSRFAS